MLMRLQNRRLEGISLCKSSSPLSPRKSVSSLLSALPLLSPCWDPRLAGRSLLTSSCPSAAMPDSFQTAWWNHRDENLGWSRTNKIWSVMPTPPHFQGATLPFLWTGYWNGTSIVSPPKEYKYSLNLIINQLFETIEADCLLFLYSFVSLMQPEVLSKFKLAMIFCCSNFMPMDQEASYPKRK